MPKRGGDPEEPPVYSPTSAASDVPDADVANLGDLRSPPPAKSFQSPPPPKHISAHLGTTVDLNDQPGTIGTHKDSEGSWKNNRDSEDPRPVPVWVPTEENSTERNTTSEAPKASSTMCPEIVTGSRLDKAVPMHPGHWIKIGRNPKAHLMCNNAGVSRNQVSVKWDPHERRVEMRLEAKAGTLVNGKEVKESRRLLEHGDRIRIVGKGQTFDFLLDLRPVGLGSGDPRYRARVAADKTKSGPTQRRDTLRAQLQHLEKAITHLEAKAFEREQEYYEIATRRRLRDQEQTERKDKHKYYVEDAKVLDVELEAGRKKWLEVLDEERQRQKEDALPVIESTSSLQEKLEKLQLKKDEVARSIHPEQYAVADVALSLKGESELEASQMRITPKPDDAEGEEDAFAGLSGLEDKHGADSSDEDLPLAAVKTKDLKKEDAMDSGSEDVDAFLKANLSGDDAPEAKKPRLGEAPTNGHASRGV